MVKINFDIDQRFNRKSDLSNGWSRQGRSSDIIHTDVYKTNIKYDGILDKLKLIIVVRGDLQNKEMIGYTWDPTSSISTLNYFLADAANHKSIVHQLDFIGLFLQANAKHKVFYKLYSRYVEFLPEYANYFGIPLRINK